MTAEDALPQAPADRASRDARALLLLLALTFLFAAPWIPQGLDFTDDGWHLTRQVGLLENQGRLVHPACALTYVSDLLGATWIAGAGSPGLLGVRLGWLALILATSAAVWLLLRPAAGTLAAALAIACAVPVSLAHGTRMIIDYNRAPFLLIVIGLALALGRRGALVAGAGGAFLGLAVWARLPGLPVIVLPLLPVLLARALDGRWEGARLRCAAIAVAAGCIVALIGFAAFAPALAAIRDERHTPAALMGRYATDGGVVAALAAAWLAVGGALDRARRVNAWATGLAGGGLFALIIVGLGGLQHRSGAPAASAWLVLIAVGGCLAILLAAFVRLRRSHAGEPLGRLRSATEILLVGLAAAFFNCVGSDNGLVKMTHGLVLALPAALFTAVALFETGASHPLPRWLAWTPLFALAAMGVVVRGAYPYRDHPDRRLLGFAIDHPRLAGIRTGRERAESVARMLAALERETRPGDALLAYGNAALTYPLSGLRPALDHPWPEYLSTAELEDRLRDLDRRGLPRAVVRARVDLSNPKWAYEPTGPPAYAARVALIDAWRERQGYRESWSNAEFAVYVAPK